jgi:hypothetical protein
MDNEIIDILTKASGLLERRGFHKYSEIITKMIVHLSNLDKKISSDWKSNVNELKKLGGKIGFDCLYTNNPSNKFHGTYEAYRAFYLKPGDQSEAESFRGSFDEVKEWLIVKTLLS